MKVICAWCKAVMTENAVGMISHSICPKCIIEMAGAEYVGIQTLDREHSLILFRYQGGSTIAVHEEEVTLKAVKQAIASVAQ